MKRLLLSITMLTVTSALKCSLAVGGAQQDLAQIEADIADAKIKYANDPIALDGVLLRLNTKKHDIELELNNWQVLEDARRR